MGQNFSWLKQVGHEFEQQRAGNLRNAVRRICVKIECRWFCKPIKGQSKSTKMRFCQLFHKNYTYWGKNLDRCWTRRMSNLRLWSVEEIDSSSSSWKSTQRKWWSDWILENQRQSSETFLVLSSLVWRKVEEKHGKRRRKQAKIPVRYWFIRSNLVTPSSSRPFRTQSHWSYFAGQCSNSEWNIPLHLPRRMRVQFSFYYQQWIDTWRPRFDQKTDSVLLACWSKRRKS